MTPAAWRPPLTLPPAAAYVRLRAIPGIGPWTAAEVGLRAYGDPDAVSVGDFHLKNLVVFAFTGRPRGSDEEMLELLEPFAGQRGRVVRLLELSGIGPPAFGPRLSPRRPSRPTEGQAQAGISVGRGPARWPRRAASQVRPRQGRKRVGTMRI